MPRQEQWSTVLLDVLRGVINLSWSGAREGNLHAISRIPRGCDETARVLGVSLFTNWMGEKLIKWVNLDVVIDILGWQETFFDEYSPDIEPRGAFIKGDSTLISMDPRGQIIQDFDGSISQTPY